MNFSAKLNRAISQNQSLLVVGLAPNPEMLSGLGNREMEKSDNPIDNLQAWLDWVIEETSTRVAAYKLNLGFYQALGVAGLKLLEHVFKKIPHQLPVILDAQHGDLNSSKEFVNLASVLGEVLKLIRETFPKSIGIEEYISPNLWQLYGDSTQLQQVLMNLCVNARDAMPDGGFLVISAENLRLDEQYVGTNSDLAVGNYILITVTDTGIRTIYDNWHCQKSWWSDRD